MLRPLSAALSFILAATAGQAQTTHIGNGVDIQASNTVQTALGIGTLAQAGNINASVSAGSSVGGHFSATTSVAGETAVSLGAATTASNYTASIVSGGTAGDARLVAVTGQVTTIALGAGARACTTIASVAHRNGSFNSFVATGDVINVGIGGLWSGHVSIGSDSPC